MKKDKYRYFVLQEVYCIRQNVENKNIVLAIPRYEFLNELDVDTTIFPAFVFDKRGNLIKEFKPDAVFVESKRIVIKKDGETHSATYIAYDVDQEARDKIDEIVYERIDDFILVYLVSEILNPPDSVFSDPEAIEKGFGCVWPVLWALLLHDAKKERDIRFYAEDLTDFS